MDDSLKLNKAIIILFFEKKVSQHQIRNILHVGADRVRDVIKHFALYQEVLIPKKRGRPFKVTPEIRQQIEELTKEDRWITCVNVGKKLNLAASTVYQIRKDLDYDYKAPKTRQNLNDTQISKRILFGNSILESGLSEELFVFSDESRFSLHIYNDHLWYKRSDCDDAIFQNKDKYQKTIMVFGAIGYHFKSKLVLFNKNVNEIYYREIFQKSEICEKLNGIHGEGQFYFIQNGATAHTSTNSKLFLQKRCSFLNFWPPNSPDLNPIEHLRGAIKKKLENRKFKSEEELFNFINQIWESFPQDKIDNLCLSFYSRLRTMINSNGQSISDILRSRINNDSQTVLNCPEKFLTIEDFITFYDPPVDDMPLSFFNKETLFS